MKTQDNSLVQDDAPTSEVSSSATSEKPRALELLEQMKAVLKLKEKEIADLRLIVSLLENNPPK